MSHIPTIEERIALLETIVLPTLEPEYGDDYFGDDEDYEDYGAECPVDGCAHFPAEAAGESESPLRADLESAIGDAIGRLREIVSEGDAEEVLGASDQLFAYLLALRSPSAS